MLAGRLKKDALPPRSSDFSNCRSHYQKVLRVNKPYCPLSKLIIIDLYVSHPLLIVFTEVAFPLEQRLDHVEAVILPKFDVTQSFKKNLAPSW